MSNHVVSNSFGPFPNRDLFQYYSTEYFELPDIAKATRVCKRWNQLFSDQNFWKALFAKEGIPLVSSTDGRERNYREDFKILYPITFSSRIIGHFFGKVIEKVPPICEEYFNALKEPDPYETDKLKGETFVFIVVPSLIARTADKETPLLLDESGSLVETSTADKQELKIPFSFKNIKVLCSYPLNGKENMPVFNKTSPPEVFEQCRTCPDKISVYFMRRHIIEQSRKESYLEQKERVKNQGFEVTPLRERVLFDVISILKEGTCPDVSKPWTYALTSDLIHYENGKYRAAVGNFSSHVGLHVFGSEVGFNLFGVAPGVSADRCL